ncbi:MAG: hypothetical protein HY720_03910 [Planctomycetes bacterium]|nr:hypothetical protein [Planctomycetota bacterium]
MEVEALRQLVEQRPFRPIRIALHSGESFVVRHPENIGITPGMVLVDEPEAPLFFEPGMVVSVELVRRDRAGRRK